MKRTATLPKDAFAEALREEEQCIAALQGEFEAFKAGSPAKDMFRKMGLDEYLEAATSWKSLRSLIVDFNDCDKGNFVAIVRDLDGVVSSGECILLHAICYACDFAWLADELGDQFVWRNMNRASGPHLRAVQACIGAWS